LNFLDLAIHLTQPAPTGGSAIFPAFVGIRLLAYPASGSGSANTGRRDSGTITWGQLSEVDSHIPRFEGKV
jgi:hypothetical protein